MTHPEVSEKGSPQIPATVRCCECGKFLGFAELAFSKHHFEPDSQFGPEVSEWTGPCCRYRVERQS